MKYMIIYLRIKMMIWNKNYNENTELIKKAKKIFIENFKCKLKCK